MTDQLARYLQVPLQSAMSGDELLFDLEEEPEDGESSEGGSSSSDSPGSTLKQGMQALPSEPITPLRRLAHSRGPPPAAAGPALAQSHTVGLHHRATQHFRKRHHRFALHQISQSMCWLRQEPNIWFTLAGHLFSSFTVLSSLHIHLHALHQSNLKKRCYTRCHTESFNQCA